MNDTKRVLLLVGSQKGTRSTSESLGTHLLDRLREKGLSTEYLRINPSLRTEKGREALRLAVEQADVLVLASPLYVDSLPWSVTRFMELIAEERKAQAQPRAQQLIAIINCGFPEARHNDTALAICRRFAVESNIAWMGGLSLGGGEAINGKPLEKAGSMARNVRRSLDFTADAVAEGKPVPQAAVDLMAKLLMPIWMYVGVGGLGWWLQARKYGASKKLRDRPYRRTDQAGSA